MYVGHIEMRNTCNVSIKKIQIQIFIDEKI